jgi:hypothetical protein
VLSSKKFLIIFFLINLVLSSFYLDNRRNPNSTSRVLQVAALSEEGVLNIDSRKDETLDKAFVNGHYYPLQPPLPSLIVFPIYKILKSLGICNEYNMDKGNSIFRLGSFLIGSLPFSLLVIWLLGYLVRGGRSRFSALVISTIPLYGSLFFIYSGVFYSHVLVGLCIAGTYFLINKGEKLFIAGILSGIAFFSEYLVAVMIAIWFFQLLVRRENRQALQYALGILPFVLGFMAYNYATTGDILHTVYSHNVAYEMTNVGFTYPRLTAFLQMLFSPWRGAFIYMPVLITCVFAINWKWEGVKNFIINPIIIPALALTLTLSAYSEWHGGWTFGPRYLMPVMILVFVGFAGRIQFDRFKKYLFWIPVSLGLVYSLITKITVAYDIPSEFKFPLTQYSLPKFMNGEFIDTSIIGGNSTFSAIAFIAAIILSGLIVFVQSRKA